MEIGNSPKSIFPISLPLYRCLSFIDRKCTFYLSFEALVRGIAIGPALQG